MGAIAGIAQEGMHTEVEQMLNCMIHRGLAGRKVFDACGATMGMIWTKAQKEWESIIEEDDVVLDYVADGHLAHAQINNRHLELTRDQLGVAPLYYGWNEEETLCFASEVKGLLTQTRNIHEVPPGHRFTRGQLECYYHLNGHQPLTESIDDMAKQLRRLLESSITDFIATVDDVGVWLSGGLDSSIMAALASKHQDTIPTFSIGVLDAPDLRYASEVAQFIESEHHEIIVNLENLLSILPEVIYHLESFDALLVRSSIINYLVAQMAADHVPAVLSGEGGDELFAGYHYLKSLKTEELPNELIAITSHLHNTALQRVDRCAAAHNSVAHVGFLDPLVVDYAFRIPIRFKLFDGVEKWVLRKAMVGLLPKNVLLRTKSKFWEGAGVGGQLAYYAEHHIKDSEFQRERFLPNGWLMNSKEELMYYRIFHQYFGDLPNLSWMGRTKKLPNTSNP